MHKSLTLVLPSDVDAALDQEASQTGSSKAALIIAHLRDVYGLPDPIDPVYLQRIEQLEHQIERLNRQVNHLLTAVPVVVPSAVPTPIAPRVSDPDDDWEEEPDEILYDFLEPDADRR